ncbi:SDR family oxidoreductase [Olleya sp. AH-315-K02]|nr:SDR family oxidoreductase [Olleya sp. AH-315-K02]MBN4084826.1 SDR family oxidoreductase [Flavobacteriaceae bacterium AH-315-B10]
MKNLKHNNKTALVTGAASGLGFQFSLLLAKDSYNLILIDIDAKNLEYAQKRIQKNYNINVQILVKDLSKPNIAQEIFEHVEEIPIDILINNAGFGLFGAFSDTKWQRESEMLNLHINTTTQLTKLFLKGMVIRGNGKILNISSLAAFLPGPLMAIYYASKAYILSFSQAIANELKGTGVTVTALCPGQTKTAFQEVVSCTSSKNKEAFNMACPIEVAKYGYTAMLKGKTVAIPGRFNKFLATLSRFVPRKMTTSIVRKIQEKNREEEIIKPPKLMVN